MGWNVPDYEFEMKTSAEVAEMSMPLVTQYTKKLKKEQTQPILEKKSSLKVDFLKKPTFK